ncbi:VWA domain-containing protein [Planococcus sp. N028]|uniref:VWA domain-containing protein n=1 Tax=Planococcus shixiaomingii TaxID=3058393 RepID=A0ABT8N0J0_9BACL|nr:VWA domain-containing protein [Planococcus sp. N028]MDN7241407.1 VWA domain-containing protein [Planococcus sp. N028]
MELRLDNPVWLWLLLPTIFYFGFLAFKTWPKSSLLYRIVFGLRIAAVALLIFALAAPSLYFADEQEQVIFLMDRSASLEGMEAEMSKAIDLAIAGKEDHQVAGVYTFAEDFQTLLPLSKDQQPVPIDLAINQNRHTNIEQALELAANSGNTDLATRIVLLTDGNETKGSAIESLERLQSSRLQVDVLQIEQKATSDAAISRFETPASAFLGEAQTFSLEIEADADTAAKLIFSVNDRDFDEKEIQLVSGKNAFSYSYPAEQEGLVKYEARIEVAEDAFLENNELASITDVGGTPEVLVVSGDVASPIPAVLDKERINVSEMAAPKLPQNLSSFLQYDAIIFDNVSGTEIGEQQMDVIEQAVKQFGVGFMMVGGDQSYGLGGYFKTPIERLLPVEMEVKGKHELPSLGLVIVMDRSGSMMGAKMELAKEAAARSVELLRKDDTVGVIAFDDQPWQIVPTEKLEDPKEAAEKILSVTPGGGTEIYKSLEEAYAQLEDLDLQRKHIILLTDGQSATSNDYDSLIEDGLENKVTLSTVSIGQDADKNLLEELAETGNGRFYDVTDATTIPAILSRETVMMSRTYIVDKPFYPIVYDSNWNALFADGVPEMNTYIATTAKGAASVALESAEEDPVLATWYYGLGKTIAYTSGSGAWSGGFQSWKNWPAFWNRNVSQLLPSFEEVPFSVTKKAQGVYSVEDPSQSSAILDIAVVDEEGKELPVQSQPTAPGKVDVMLDADPGLVFFSISNENGAAYRTGLAIPYGDEYRTDKPNSAMLTTLAERTGGKVVESLNEAFRNIPYESGTKQPIQQSLLLAAMILFFIDITLRRFGLKLPKRQLKAAAVGEVAPKTVEQLIKAKKRS